MKNTNLTFALIYVFIFTVLHSTSNAQCEVSTAQIDLESNNISTRLHVSGDLWWDGTEGKYLFPKPPSGFPELGVSSIKVGGIWMGGFDPGGNLKMAAQTNGRAQGFTDYWPGPDAVEDNCLNFDRFWTITSDDIDQHIADYADNGMIDGPVPPAILAWPGDGNPESLNANGFEIPNGVGNQFCSF